MKYLFYLNVAQLYIIHTYKPKNAVVILFYTAKGTLLKTY